MALKFKSNYAKWSQMMDTQQNELKRLYSCSHTKAFLQLLMDKNDFEYKNQKLIENASLTEWLSFTNLYIDRRIKYVQLLQQMTCEKLSAGETITGEFV